MYSLMTGNPPLVDFQADTLNSPHDSWPSFTPQVHSSLFVRAVCLVCSEIKAQLHNPMCTPEGFEGLRQLKKEAFRIEASMRNWTENLAKWQPCLKEVSLESMDIRIFAHSDLVEYHDSSFPLTHWNLYRTSRIALHETLLGADISLQAQFDTLLAQTPAHPLSTTSPQPFVLLNPQERHHCQTALSNMSSQLLGTIPYILGSIDSQGTIHNPLLHGSRACAGKAHQGLPVIWPLRIIKRSLYTDDHQKHLATEALKRIGWGMGIRQALEVAHT